MKAFKVSAVMLAVGLATFGIVAGISADDATTIDDVVKDMQENEIAPVVSDPNSNPPKLTPQMVLNVVNKLREVEKNGGYLGIARSEKISCDQVRAIHDRVKERLAEIHTGP